MSLLSPQPLRPGDRVAVVAPSGPFDRAVFEKGLEVLATRYQPVFTERLFERRRYLAGTDAARAEELQRAFDDDSFRAVFAARGGYGAMRILPSLRLGRPKWLVGFSDITALHLGLQAFGWRSVHAPVLTQLGTQTRSVAERLFAHLEGTEVTPLTGTRTLVPGVAEGPLIGGNLSVLTRLLGTPYFPSLRGAVLLLEDVGERPYRLDRMWTHLQLAGVLEGVAGVVFGDFTGCEEKDADYGSLDVLLELATSLGVPCAGGFRIGHGEVNEPVLLGAPVRLDADAFSLRFLPEGTA